MDFIPESRTVHHTFPHRCPHRGVLPEGRYYTLTWGIPDSFGGMTPVVLERSSAFARQDNRTVEILTLSDKINHRDRERQLRVEGRIDRRVRLHNVRDDLVSWPDRKLRRMGGTPKPDHTAVTDVLERTGMDWVEYRREPDDAILQVDRYHDRGELLLIDRSDMRTRGQRGGRRITLFDRKQNVIAQWATARAFYQAWIDVVIESGPAYLISDSSLTGGLIFDYRRDNVILCQVVHNHFLGNPQGDNLGELPRGKIDYMSNFDSFGVVTILTGQQHGNMDEANLSSSGFCRGSFSWFPKQPLVQSRTGWSIRNGPRTAVGNQSTHATWSGCTRTPTSTSQPSPRSTPTTLAGR